MAQHDQRIDAYMNRAADFAKPILNHLRQVVHQACPHVQETMKWSFPHFDYNENIMCSMAAFKQHCTFGFWLAALMQDSHKILNAGSEKTAMGHFGAIKNIADLPSDKILVAYIKEAMMLIEKGVKQPKKEKPATTGFTVPSYFLAELKKNKQASVHFEKFSSSQKKEYVQWLEEAKTEATRGKRMTTAVEWVAEGKIRNWKYIK